MDCLTKKKRDIPVLFYDAGIDSTSCAYRCAVTDESAMQQRQPKPSVYILGRSTNIPIVSRLGTALFLGDMQLIQTSLKDATVHVEVQASYRNGQDLFVTDQQNHRGVREVEFKAVLLP